MKDDFVRIDRPAAGYREYVPGTLVCTRCEQFVHTQDISKHNAWHADIERRYG